MGGETVKLLKKLLIMLQLQDIMNCDACFLAFSRDQSNRYFIEEFTNLVLKWGYIDYWA